MGKIEDYAVHKSLCNLKTPCSCGLDKVRKSMNTVLLVIEMSPCGGTHLVFRVPEDEADDLRERCDDKLSGDGNHGVPTVVERIGTKKDLLELLNRKE
jgi:hypothetical protein